MYKPTDIRSDFGWKLIAISNPFVVGMLRQLRKLILFTENVNDV